jgi:predicted transposase/invertase (TIGR01784 family)
MHIFDAHNIFPEYFIVSIHLFDDVIKEEIHEWLYYMKHAQVKKYFKSPYMKKVGQRLDILKMTNKERNIYDSYVMDAMKGRDYIVSAVAKGMQEGMKKRTVLDIAKNMLADNFDINEISKLTALTVEKIQQLHTQVLS